MEKADTILDGEKAMEYWDRCRLGITQTLEETLEVLNEVNEATDNERIQKRVEHLIFKLEAQLKH
jgi:DNA-binding transcriptional regulator GbsR (MarR family)